MKKIFQIIMISAILSTAIWAIAPKNKEGAKEEQGSYDRIMQKNEMRCGYVSYPPLLSKDPNTGEFSGIGADVMRRVAGMLHVKLVWTEETSWASYIDGLNANRYDALCTLDFFLPEYVGRIDITRPLFYTGIGVYKRADDNRFVEGDKSFNDPSVTISAIDGSLSMLIKNTDYPDAKIVSMPAMSEYATILMNIAAKKADVAFVERAVANNYLKSNPGTLVNIAENKPLRVFPYVIPSKFGEGKWQTALDQAVEVLVENGEMDKILDKYEKATPSFYRVAKNYK